MNRVELLPLKNTLKYFCNSLNVYCGEISLSMVLSVYYVLYVLCEKQSEVKVKSRIRFCC